MTGGRHIRPPIDGRFEVRLISAQALAQYMQFRGFTVRSLAFRIGVSPSTIGHLRSGARTYANPATARAIEAALNAPPGSLFVPRVLHIARDVTRDVA